MRLNTTLLMIGAALAALPAFGQEEVTQKQEVLSVSPATRSDSPVFSELLAQARAAQFLSEIPGSLKQNPDFGALMLWGTPFMSSSPASMSASGSTQ
jgi:hypothetical protein